MGASPLKEDAALYFSNVLYLLLFILLQNKSNSGPLQLTFLKSNLIAVALVKMAKKDDIFCEKLRLRVYPIHYRIMYYVAFTHFTHFSFILTFCIQAAVQ